jgi:hypothetical protein
MEQLVKRFKEIDDNVNLKEIDSAKEYCIRLYTAQAQECKQVAIEFAKHILQSKITKCTEGSIGTTRIQEEYWPAEYQILLGELARNADSTFNKFLEEYGK